MSTKVKIGSARIDERKKISGGKAGDQTKFEVSTQDFYQHPKGWLVLRPTAFAKEIAKNMRDACENNNIGYSQTDRYSLMRALEKVDSFKEVGKCNCDCSSLVRECVRKAFKKYVSDFNTESEKFVDVVLDFKSHSLILPSPEALAKTHGTLFTLYTDIAVITVECPWRFSFTFDLDKSHITIIPPLRPE